MRSRSLLSLPTMLRTGLIGSRTLSSTPGWTTRLISSLETRSSTCWFCGARNCALETLLVFLELQLEIEASAANRRKLPTGPRSVFAKPIDLPFNVAPRRVAVVHARTRLTSPRIPGASGFIAARALSTQYPSLPNLPGRQTLAWLAVFLSLPPKDVQKLSTCFDRPPAGAEQDHCELDTSAAIRFDQEGILGFYRLVTLDFNS